VNSFTWSFWSLWRARDRRDPPSWRSDLAAVVLCAGGVNGTCGRTQALVTQGRIEVLPDASICQASICPGHRHSHAAEAGLVILLCVSVLVMLVLAATATAHMNSPQYTRIWTAYMPSSHVCCQGLIQIPQQGIAMLALQDAPRRSSRRAIAPFNKQQVLFSYCRQHHMMPINQHWTRTRPAAEGFPLQAIKHWLRPQTSNSTMYVAVASVICIPLP
jgi:hypothetical protein